MAICNLCNKGELVHDKKMSGLFCTGCGECFELGATTDEVQFREDQRGRFLVVGTTYNVEKGFRNSKFSSHGQLLSSVNNAKTILKRFCDKLYISESFAQISSGIYHQLLIKKFMNGRRLNIVLAACLYIAVRSEGANVILLDISDVSEANVYDIGRYYFQIIHILHFKIQTVDPSEYIVRFTDMLNLGDRKLTQVKRLAVTIRDTANRLVQRMKRDWIHYGRRPSGVCAAAVLVAARLNNVRCTIKDIVSIAKVCDTTIRKRIHEFIQTPASKLTLQEFMSQDLDGEEDPPCFKISSTMEGVVQANLVKVEKFQEIIEEHLKDSRAKMRGVYAKFLKDILVNMEKDDGEKPPVSGGENSAIKEAIIDQNILAVDDKLMLKLNQDLKEDEDNGNPTTEEIEYWAKLRPSAQSLGLLKRERPEDDSKADYEDLLENGLDALDDEEINRYIIDDPGEIGQRKLEWTTLNKDFLEKEQKEALKKFQKEQEKNDEKKPSTSSSGKSKKKNKRRKLEHDQIEASSTSQAVESAFKANSIRLNDINLKELFNEESNEETKTAPASVAALQPEKDPITEDSPVPETPISTDGRLVSIYHSYAMKKSTNDDEEEEEVDNDVEKDSDTTFKGNLPSSSQSPSKEIPDIEDDMEDDYFEDEDDELNKIKQKYSIEDDYGIGGDIEDCGF